jgi:predicted DsbA family dithiol-disulfide isomerase
MKHRLLRAYMTEGRALGDKKVLTELGAEILDESEVAALLEGHEYSDAVRADEQRAQKIGVSGVPFFTANGYGASGAQESETLLRLLTKAWEEMPVEGRHEIPYSSGPAL